jgi:predicted metal-dependent HD superfamily phosphohydrolase
MVPWWDDPVDLERRWPLAGASGLRDRLTAAYADPDRGYHDVLHLEEVLTRLDELRTHGVGFHPLTVPLAAWFHDSVYDGRPDAEERSARWAEEALPGAGVPPAQVAEVARLVRLTERHDPEPGDVDGAALCDADLAVLSSPPDRYRAYTEGVRREYAHVPELAFRDGRSAVLRALLDRPHLFITAQAREQWEAAARGNVSRELASLSAPPG